MKAARIVVLGVALIAGGAAAMLASRGHEPEPPKPQPAIETVEVLVAKADLIRGQVIQASDVGWQTWPKGAANPAFIKKSDRPDAVAEFTGAIVRVPLATGEPIRDPAVVFAKGSGFLAAVLPKGMRAVSLDISPDNAAGGFVLPDDHVDIVLTRRDKAAEKANGGIEKFVSDTILKNVRVLAVDQAVEEKSGQKVVIGKTATVELSPSQAETLAMSRQQGTLSLALRSLLDSPESAPTGGADEEHSVEWQIDTIRYGLSALASKKH